MAKPQQKVKPGQAAPSSAAPPKRAPVPAIIAGVVILVVAAAALLAQKNRSTGSDSKVSSSAGPAANTASSVTTKSATELPTMAINQAVMVTVELDFGPKVPRIAEGLLQVERRYKPDDGVGRTFAVLDAYGEPTADGKLHMSMHVSSEKPGIGALVFKRTGEVLWQSQIINTNPAVKAFTGKNLTILVDDGAGKTFMVDGSSGPSSILDANVKEMGIPMRVFWPDGTEREFTFVYSACGCPVKAMVKRVGEGTVRTKELPVMFPDDPAAITMISQLMKWQ